jgi:hypothetical protein
MAGAMTKSRNAQPGGQGSRHGEVIRLDLL